MSEPVRRDQDIKGAARRAVVSFLDEWGSLVLAFAAFVAISVTGFVALWLVGVEVSHLALGSVLSTGVASALFVFIRHREERTPSTPALPPPNTRSTGRRRRCLRKALSKGRP